MEEETMLRMIAVGATLLAFGAFGTLNAQAPAPVAPSPVKRTIVQKADVPGTNLEVIYATVEIAPGFKAGRHSHPGVVMAQVIEGEFWLHLDGQPEKVYRAGEALTLPDRAVHNEGAQGQGPAKLSAVYVLEKGKPLASPAQ
jgi:quercetin dioxygenase-like cupin family protein